MGVEMIFKLGLRALEMLQAPRYLNPALGERCLYHNTTTGNSMINQDRIETNLLQLFAHQEN